MIFSAVLTIQRRFRNGAASITDSDADPQDGPSCPSVECGEEGWWQMGFAQPSQNVKMLLGFFGYGAGDEGPGKVLWQVGIEEFGALDDLH